MAEGSCLQFNSFASHMHRVCSSTYLSAPRKPADYIRRSNAHPLSHLNHLAVRALAMQAIKSHLCV